MLHKDQEKDPETDVMEGVSGGGIEEAAAGKVGLSLC